MFIVVILLCIIAGMAVGFIFRRNVSILKAADKASVVAVFILLFFLGAGIGHDAGLFAQLPALGLRALVITLCCSLGSVAGILCLSRLLSADVAKRDKAGESDEKKNAPAVEKSTAQKGECKNDKKARFDLSPLKSSGRILACFLSGLFLARFGLLPLWFGESYLVDYSLWLLIFAVGIGLGGELKAFRVLRDMHVKVLAVPIVIVIGSVAGSALACAILPKAGFKDTLSVGSGLGYYSLSSIMIRQATGNAALASVALLSNVFRELLGILTAPILARFFPLAPVAVAGATAMDTGLPGIARYCGERYAIIAVFSGVTLTLAVPFMVSFVLGLDI